MFKKIDLVNKKHYIKMYAVLLKEGELAYFYSRYSHGMEGCVAEIK